MRSLFIGLSTFLISACAAFPTHVDPPKVEVQSLRVVDPSLTAATFIFGLRVDNPNGFDLDLESLDYSLKINGRELSTGQTDEERTLPQRDKAIVDLPFRVSYTSLFRSFEELITHKTVDYELVGTAHVHGRRIPFELKGKTDLPGGLRGPAD